MSESLEPGSHASLTHSPCRGLALSRAFAVLLLGGSAMFPALPANVPAGAARSAPFMCAMCSSLAAALLHPATATRARHPTASERIDVMTGLRAVIENPTQTRGE